MKTSAFKIGLAVIGVTLLQCTPYAQQSYTTADQRVTIEIFYNELSPYGRWIDYAPFGYVWIPSVSSGFSPYLTSGHWVYTEFGWTWYSYYRWGWAPFHYGRWHYDTFYGWIWLPDTVWGPGWVAWRNGGGYCAWAPLDFGVTVNVIILGTHVIPPEYWVYVRDTDLPRREVHRYRVQRSRSVDLEHQAPISRQVREYRSITYMPGPERADIQKATNEKLEEVKIRDRVSPGATRFRKNELEIYRPWIKAEVPGEVRPAPPKISQPGELENRARRPARERRTITQQPGANQGNADEQDQVKPEVQQRQQAPRLRQPPPASKTPPSKQSRPKSRSRSSREGGK